MKKIRLLCAALLAVSMFLCLSPAAPAQEEAAAGNRILVQGHASLRITTAEGKVIYIDPYTGDGYDLPADLILVTHDHSDHNRTKLIKNRNEGCRTITWKEALKDGIHQTFDLGWVKVEAVEAGNNRNHDIRRCVGYILTFSDGKTLYVSGDTSTTDQMASLGERQLDYAFFCCDGTYNMGMEEAMACAALVNARVSIPYHPAADQAFIEKYGDRVPEGCLLITAGTEFTME
ncbi:MAG: MBL fold metallo-hydrolase [Clostridiales bacterium]|nr:MBL fold metallo-hydrolase [Clostridiales bacterium]